MRVKRVFDTILVVDDDEGVCAYVKRELSRAGKTVFCAGLAADAMEIALREEPDLALVDVMLPDRDGLKLLAELREALPELALIGWSGYPATQLGTSAGQLGAIAFLEKPIRGVELLRIMDDVDPPDLAQFPSNYRTLPQIEWDHMIRTLGLTNGNLARAADRLGISRSSLQRRLKKSPPGREDIPYVPPSKRVRRGPAR